MIKSLLGSDWCSRLSQFNNLFVGFSGGLDSTVLLHVLASHSILFPKLIPVHVNHGLSNNADFWQTHCEQFCHQLALPLMTRSVQINQQANIEERARTARYSVFSSLITNQDCLVLGHHLDDQAETVFLQLFRGAGIDGLAAMSDLNSFALGQLARPFLSRSREQLEHYANLHQLSWIEDESNQDISYSRNYLRQHIMPLLKNKWPGVSRNIARTAIHCQQAKRNLDALVAYDCAFLSDAKGEYSLKNTRLFIEPLQEFNFDRIANIIRVWLKNNQLQLPSTVTFHRLIDEVLFAREDAIPEVRWGSCVIRRYQKYLYLEKITEENSFSSIEWKFFPTPLIIGNSCIKLIATKSKSGLVLPKNAIIEVKFRQGGERFVWHGQTKQLKKLIQEWGIPPWLREKIPLVFINNTLAVVVGYAISDLFFSKNNSDAWIITNEV